MPRRDGVVEPCTGKDAWWPWGAPGIDAGLPDQAGLVLPCSAADARRGSGPDKPAMRVPAEIPDTAAGGTEKFTPASPGNEKSASPEVRAAPARGRALSMGAETEGGTAGAARMPRRRAAE